MNWLNKHILLKNLLLIICIVVILVFAAYVFLGIFTHHNRHKIVPDLTGMTFEQALDAGREGKLRIEIIDSVYVPDSTAGVIMLQRPAAGIEVKSGRRVAVTINAHAPRMVRIPYVTGVSRRQAESDLRTAGFRIGEPVFKPDIANNYVLETRFGGQTVTRSSGMEAPMGAEITLVIGRNND